jgi:hypothetical protein
MAYDTPQRLDWHFIPKDARKGLQIKDMDDAQRQATHQLLQGLLSQVGYDKATQIMHLENVLHEYESARGPIRDPLRYFVTFFDQPTADGRWGVSFEGHHLSLNYVLDGGRVISSSPQVFATNPAIMKGENKSGVAVGTRILDKEETLAFELVNSLSDQQRQVAVIADRAPREILSAATPQVPRQEPAGIAAGQLAADQKTLLFRLIDAYIDAMPQEVAQQRRQDIEQAGRDAVQFAWAGSLKPGVGHYYRIQGPTFWIELVNTQPDAMGNPANHVHSIWRDPRGDFALPAAEG